MKIKTVKMIQVGDWDRTVEETYKKIYSFQQQEGCREKGVFHISIPDETDDFENDIVPEIVNYEERGVSFEAWLNRDIKTPLKEGKHQYKLQLWWERNFYPDIQMIANDLCKKGIIERGDYIIEIDW